MVKSQDFAKGNDFEVLIAEKPITKFMCLKLKNLFRNLRKKISLIMISITLKYELRKFISNYPKNIAKNAHKKQGLT